MYNLSYFKEEDQAVVIEFMKQHPFAMLIGCYENQPAATQVPLHIGERDGKMILTGHMMRKQDHHLAFEKNPNVLVVFTGPHTYVSATLYANPHQASTWNYISVHAKGMIQFLDEKGLEAVLQQLTMHYENQNVHSPTVFANLGEDYRRKLMKSIVAFEVEVKTIENVFKLSQNRDKESFAHIVNHLGRQDNDARIIADEMNKRNSLFENDDQEP